MEIIRKCYSILYERFGPQKWWPAETVDETIIGAILTQNVSWKNVEKAIKNLKEVGILTLENVLKTDEKKLSELIISTRFSNQKARYLKEISNFFKEYNFDYEKVRSLSQIRKILLKVKGVGKETCDTVLLYALKLPYFVIDAYTKRIFSRIGIINKNISYDELQNIFHNNLEKDVNLYNEYHALIVKLGKEFCKNKPLCNECPLNKKICLGVK